MSMKNEPWREELDTLLNRLVDGEPRFVVRLGTFYVVELIGVLGPRFRVQGTSPGPDKIIGRQAAAIGPGCRLS